MLKPYATVIAVRDMNATAEYFRDALGFAIDWAEATDWRLVSRGQVRLMIGHCPNVIPISELGDHGYVAYLKVEDIGALHSELVGRGAIIRMPPTDRPYGMREMLVATPDGHRIMIAS